MESSGREQNYWPGFVDALSNVVLTLVFVLVVFVFALLIASNKVERKAAEMVQQAHAKANKNQSVDVVATLEAQLEDATAEIKDLKEQLKNSTLDKAASINVDEKGSLKVEGAVTISKKDNRIVIQFPPAISDLDPASMSELDNVLKDFSAQIKGHMTILSYVGNESYSAAKRLAYYRVLGIRNHILQNPAYKQTQISNQIVTPKEIQNGRIEIIFD